MKFEKLSSLKFENFKPCSLKNMNAIVGGGNETSSPGKIDDAGTASGTNLDSVVTSNEGSSIRSDRQK